MKIGEMAAAAKPDPNGVQLMAVPLFHITALCPVGLFSIPMGSKVIMMRKWDAGAGLKIIEKEQVRDYLPWYTPTDAPNKRDGVWYKRAASSVVWC